MELLLKFNKNYISKIEKTNYMLVKKILERVESSEYFKTWKKTNYYLAYMFTSSKEEWQVGYYNKEKDNMRIFQVDEKVTKLPESEVFKEKKTVKKLDLKI